MWKNTKNAFILYKATSICHATPWCNGSTSGFGPLSLGSNPDGVAIFFITWES